MGKIVTIDAGTSNVRIKILENNKIIASSKSSYGVKVGNEIFKEQLYKLLVETLTRHDIKMEDIECIIGSGMISSNLGLHLVEHLELPVSLDDLATHIETVEFFGFKINLITGIKVHKDYLNNVNINTIDVIRGEETETIGVMEKMSLKDGLIILPGSHNKFIEVSNGKIINFITTMSGEIYDFMTKNTILNSSLKSKFADEVNIKFLRIGKMMGDKYGLNQASFILRGIDLCNNFTFNEKANYLLGVVLSNDIISLVKSGYLKKYENIIIAGSNILAKGLYYLLKDFCTNIQIVDSNDLSMLGAVKIWNIRKGREKIDK